MPLIVWVVLAYDSDFNLVAILFSLAATIDVTSCSDWLAAGFVAVPRSAWVGCSRFLRNFERNNRAAWGFPSHSSPRLCFCPKKGQFLTLSKQKTVDIDSSAKEPRQTKNPKRGQPTFPRHKHTAVFWHFYAKTPRPSAPAVHLQGVFGYGSQMWETKWVKTYTLHKIAWFTVTKTTLHLRKIQIVVCHGFTLLSF